MENNRKTKKIFNKIVLGFTIVGGILILVGTIGILGLFYSDESMADVFTHNIAGTENAGKITADILEMSIESNKMIFSAYELDNVSLQNAKFSFDATQDNLESLLDNYKKTISSDEEITLVKEIEVLIPEYVKSINDFYEIAVSAVMSGSTSVLKGELNASAELRENLIGKLDELLKINVEQAEAKKIALSKNTGIIEIVLIVLEVMGGISAIMIALAISTWVENGLSSVVQKLHDSTMVVDMAATQLMGASQSLADGSSRQAAAIEETSATMNESATMLQQTTANTRQASELASAMNERAEAGMVRMTSMLDTMENIKESSDVMSKTVKIINEIAFQTNLLAINATVEAARAGGEAGRSFGAVAEEVRNLAQRSAKSAEDTADTIAKNLALTAQGMESSREVAKSLRVIINDVGQVTQLIEEIKGASEEQTGGITQVTQAINQMEKVTQQNAAVSEENAALSSSLKEEITVIMETVEIAEGFLKNKSMESIKRPNSSTSSHSTTTRSAQSQTNISKTSLSSTENKTFQATQAQKKATGKDPEKIIPLNEDDSF